MATKYYKLSEVLDFSKKSQRKAGDGLTVGRFPFFTSSQIQSKWLDESDYMRESIILGTGGSPSIHIAKEFSTSADTFILFTINKLVSIKYIYYFLLGNISILEKGFKGAGLKHLSRQYTEKITIPFPVDENGELDIYEQNRIVSLLDEISYLKRKKDEANQKMEQLIPAVFEKIFGDTSAFSKRPLSKFCIVTTGNTPPRVNKEYYGSDLEWIKTDNISEKEMYPSRSSEHLSSAGVSVGRTVESNSILVNCIAGSIKTIGAVCLTNRKVSFNQQINAITIQDKTNPLFLYWYLKINKKETQRLASGMLKFIINKTRLESLNVPIVSEDLQDKFAKLVLEIESNRNIQKKATLKLDELFNTIVSSSFLK